MDNWLSAIERQGEESHRREIEEAEGMVAAAPAVLEEALTLSNEAFLELYNNNIGQGYFSMAKMKAQAEFNEQLMKQLLERMK